MSVCEAGEVDDIVQRAAGRLQHLLEVLEGLHDLGFAWLDQLHGVVATDLAGHIQGAAHQHAGGITDLFVDVFHSLGNDGLALWHGLAP
jgi:hypothetical protein